jgi:hypothetical protein
MSARIPIDKDKLAEFCRRHHVRKLALFGSVLRDDFRSDSDVDVLYALEAGHQADLAQLIAMEAELSAIFSGRRVDLVPAEQLKRRIKARVIAEAEVQYAQG